MSEFKSFFKTVGGGEGERCNYTTRLDTYGKGCANNCSYCYARSLLEFRKLWNPEEPGIADIDKVRRTIQRKTNPNMIVRLGGMTDCFQEAEKENRVTYQAIQALNEQRTGYLIVTKNPLVATDEYIEVMDKDLAHIQVSITATNDQVNSTFESAEPYTQRKAAIEKLHRMGFDVQVRLSLFIPEFIELDELNSIECDKILIEFLRVNHWIRTWLDIDFSEYTLKQGSYRHLPLEKKLELLRGITGFKEYTVCDDVPEHYEYFSANYNHNPNDCCNLRIKEG